MWIKIFNRRYNMEMIENYSIDISRHGTFLVLEAEKRVHHIHFDSGEEAEAEMKRLDDLLEVK